MLLTTEPVQNRFTDNHQNPLPQSQSTNPRADIVQWKCLNCGQHIFVVIEVEPPDTCDYCNDMTTWTQVNGKR